MRDWERFVVVSPDGPGQPGPVLAEVSPCVFKDNQVPQQPYVELPVPDGVLDGKELYKGIVVFGLAHVFVSKASEVQPHELTLTPTSWQQFQENSNRGDTWH